MNNPEEHEKKLRKIIDFARSRGNLYQHIPPPPEHGFSEYWESVSSVSVEKLWEHRKALSYYPDNEVRYLSSVFTAGDVDNLFLVPQRIDESWQMLRRSLKKTNPKVAMLSVPPFWQIGPFFYTNCRLEKVPISVMSPRNIPLMLQVIEEVDIEYVTTTAEIASELFRQLALRGIEGQIKKWHIIVPFSDRKVEVPSVSGEISFELHAFPGVPVGYFENVHLHEGEVSVSGNSEYLLEKKNSIWQITSLKEHALPLIKLEIHPARTT